MLSKSTEAIDRNQKLPLYAAQGGRWREVRVYQGDVRVRVAPFDAIELELAAMWSPPRVT